VSEIKPDLSYALSRGWTKESLAEPGIGSFEDDREGPALLPDRGRPGHGPAGRGSPARPARGRSRVGADKPIFGEAVSTLLT
jgi:hypothetical protein